MAAANTDLLTKVGLTGTATTLAAPGYTIGNTSINVGNTANWPTDTGVVFAVDQVTTQIINGVSTQVRVAGTYCEFEGTVLSSTQIGNLALKQGTSQNYPAGSNTRVYIPVASTRENNLVTWGLGHANQDGSLKTSAVQTALNLGTSALNGWNPLGFTFTYGANNGNKEFTVTTPSDLTATLSKGMKLQFTRGTTAPTQAMSFTAASSQYATKASPAGITFTAAYTCEAWIYLNSYTGNDMTIIARLDKAGTTGGWRFTINAAGQVTTLYGTGSTLTEFTSTQSVPLKRWVHVAAAVSSVASKTCQIYINAVAVPTSTSASASTTLTQAAVDLRVGAQSATPAGTYFDGYISEARVWSVGQTQVAIQANMAVSLAGSETNLVALFQGNGTFVDKTANANTLTANGGAIATQAANPYNNVEYGILTNISYSNPNTTLTIFTGTDYNIPNMTLSGPQYSTMRAPFGFPNARGRWISDVWFGGQINGTISAVNTWTSTGTNISIPAGEWRYGYEGTFANTNGSGSNSGFFTLATSTPTNSIYNQEITGRLYVQPAATFHTGALYRDAPLALSSQTVYTMYSAADAGGATLGWRIGGDQGLVKYFAESAYV